MKLKHNRIESIRGSLITIKTTRAMLGEMAVITKTDGTVTYAVVIRFNNHIATLQVFESTRGISTGNKVELSNTFHKIKYGSDILGRRLNGAGHPSDTGPELSGQEISLGNPSFNPVNRIIPKQMVKTNIPMIDMFNCLVKSQKIPIFSSAGEPYNELLMRISNQTDADVVVIGGMGLTFDTYQQFIDNSQSSGRLNSTVMFVHRATDPTVECLLVPDAALACAEKMALENKEVLVLLTDMTAYADAIKEITITMDQIPSNRGYPGSLYSELAYRYEKAVDIANKGSITIIAVTTMPGDDVTHPIPDNTGYITEGQFYLNSGRINPFGSLSRLKQQVIGKETREDHGDLANAMIKLYAEAKKAQERQSMGFNLSGWDQKLLSFQSDFETKLMALDVNLDITDALNLGWSILSDNFNETEVGIKSKLVSKY